MARYIATVIIGLGFALPTLATTHFIYPTSIWNISTHQGEEIGDGLYHMGVDVAYEFPAGTPVYAVSDGVVKEAQERSQFGLVVLIEHTPENEDANVSLYGHLDPGNVMVQPGQRVQSGDLIGTLGSPDVNGGWAVHLHFGIHKGAYTGQWVYYGHVHNPATGEDWLNPETYLPEHFIVDNWDPTIDWGLADGTIIGNTLTVDALIGDIGSARVASAKVKIQQADSSWSTARSIDNPDYHFYQPIDISDYSDGDLAVQLITRDAYGHKKKVTKQIVKDPYRFTTPAFVTMLSGNSNAQITQWSFGDTVLNSFSPFKTSWAEGALVALGEWDTPGERRVIAVRSKTVTAPALAKVFTETGELVTSFELLRKPSAIAVANSELWVADTTGVITIYNMSGEVVQQSAESTRAWTSLVVSGETILGCSRDKQVPHVVKLNADLTEARSWRAFKRHTGCQLAIAELTGDDEPELVLSTTGKTPALAKITRLGGKPVVKVFAPFGDSYSGKLSVSAAQWDYTEDAITEHEVLFAQAGKAQGWVKGYRFSGDTQVLFTRLVADSSWTQGVLVAGWQ